MLKLQDSVNILVFCSNKQISKTMSYFENKKLSCTLLVWNKTNPIPLCNGKHVSDVEFVVYVRGKKAHFNNTENISNKYKVKRFPSVKTKGRLHPTEKNVELLMEYINLHSFEGDVILDCFSGSCSTGIACLNTNRNFIGIEKEKNFFSVGKNRVEKYIKEKKIQHKYELKIKM